MIVQEVAFKLIRNLAEHGRIDRIIQFVISSSRDLFVSLEMNITSNNNHPRIDGLAAALKPAVNKAAQIKEIERRGLFAISTNNIQRTDQLSILEKGGNPNITDCDGGSALMSGLWRL